jgi:integrase
MALFRMANVVGSDGRTPRIHDFRHSFAVHALLRWYRTGADVPSKLPKLAPFLGHVSIVSTAYYLQWLPEIADAARARFEAYVGPLITGGSPR